MHSQQQIVVRKKNLLKLDQSNESDCCSSFIIELIDDCYYAIDWIFYHNIIMNDIIVIKISLMRSSEYSFPKCKWEISVTALSESTRGFLLQMTLKFTVSNPLVQLHSYFFFEWACRLRHSAAHITRSHYFSAIHSRSGYLLFCLHSCHLLRDSISSHGLLNSILWWA